MKARSYSGFPSWKVESNLLVLGIEVVFALHTSLGTNRELDTVACELTTIGDGVHWGSVLVQEIDLFQGQSLGLGDAEVSEQQTPSTGRSPDEEHLDLETSGTGLFVDQVGVGVTDTKVPEPVGGGGKGHGLGTDTEREDLASDDPSDGTPCGGEEGDVDADESDQNLLSSGVRCRDRDTHDGDQELANTHAGGTDQEQPPTTKPLNTPHARKSHEDVDNVGGDGDQEGVMNTRVLEEHGTVVEDEVDTGKLLPRLDEDTSKGTEKDLVVAGAEAVEVRRLSDILLVLEGNTDLVEFGLELWMIGRKGDETGESMSSIIVALFLDEPSRRLGEEDHADGENETPNKLDTDGDSPRSMTGLVLGGVVDNRREEETDGDRPLVAGDDRATNPLGRTLGLVHGDQHGNHTNTPTGEDTTHDEEREGKSSRLHGNTDGKDEDSEDDGPSPTEDICGRGGE